MNTRTFLNLLFTVVVSLFAYGAHAGEFSMGSNNLHAQMDHTNNSQSAQLDAPREPFETESRSMAGSGIENMPSGTIDSGRANTDPDDDRASARQTNGEGVATKRAETTPGNNKTRASNRWQSLVPGAIR